MLARFLFLESLEWFLPPGGGKGKAGAGCSMTLLVFDTIQKSTN